jgi:hypothetical protein
MKRTKNISLGSNIDFVGMYCVAYKGEEPQFRGQILARPEPGYYLVLFLHMMRYDSRIFEFEDMLEWRFFDNMGSLQLFEKYVVEPYLDKMETSPW